MAKETTKDMTSGNPVKLILSFGAPLLLGNIFQQLYNMVDTIIVGRGIGVNALAAVGSTGSINFLILGFVLGLTQGLSILVSQYYGAQNYKKLRKSITMSTYLALAVGIFITIISVVFSRQLLVLMNTPQKILEDATSYIRIIFAGTLIIITFNVFSGILRALGDGRTPLHAMVISTIINIILDVVFVIILKMGVNGAAYATLIAQVVASVYCLIKLQKIKEVKINKEDWKFDFRLFILSFKLGIPVALMNSVTAAGVMVLQFVVNSYGAIYVAAYSAGTKIAIILEQVGNSFGFAIATYVGQNYGAKKADRIKVGVKKIVFILTGVNAILAILMFVFGKLILALIVSSEETEVIAIAYRYIVIISIFLWVLGLLFIYRYSLQSMGDTFIPMISGVLEFVFRIVFAILLKELLDFTAVSVAEVSAWISATLLLVFGYYKHIKSLEKVTNKL